ncbi:MAG: DUF5615 family PIN-like protein [Chloroflexota bacterium]
MTGTPLKLFLDEHIWRGLTEALRKRGYDAIAVEDVGKKGEDDEPLLVFATTQGRAILTYNISDFSPLAKVWYEAGRDHAGIILSKNLEKGELLRRVTKLLETVTAEEMKNAVRYLQDFK